MSSDADGGDERLPPDDAFGVLGNETRVAILRALGEADGPVAFSALRERVGMPDSGQFNYHLDRLTGHFVERTDEGYALRRAGERVIEAVLSGAVTEAPEREPTVIDQSCEYCGSPVGIRYREEKVRVFCTGCAGVYGPRVGPEEYGLLGTLFLPPAGVQGRDADELFRAASIWGGTATIATVNGVCPRCSATLEESVEVCDDHDAGDGVCGACDGRYAVTIRYRCTNCIFERAGAFGASLLTDTDLLAFLTAHGINPVTRSGSAVGAAMDYEETVVSTEPFEARFTFTAGGDALTLTVGEELSVVDVTEGSSAGAGEG